MTDILSPAGLDAVSGGPLLGPGRLVLVVGPSGAGKDTLLNGLRARLSARQDCVFARRLITRDTDGETEDHDSLGHDEYRQLSGSGEVALCWEAHGHGYVIPKSCDAHITAGRMVIANGSRRALPQALAKYDAVTVLLITAPKDVLAQRLAARGRESEEEIRRRLDRSDLEVSGVPHVVRIENTGTVDQGVDAIMAALGL
ncbi:phosphonate metabolism protein/1,5-bisphosphokinase (PRPP-forming) PhnN [Roseibium aestuarii]|uniref:Ribose 1,5-bisphosphate phosphokinase PhnN n=1 Tax=Roseibium aestuarii TaxID=2600299 RepID=A0ABW4K2C7_9HYPH|nr:phosphonate metabolism protein/1,5-bisphosphokinase (PRPP-forming) PhnN [Roseibium aestuarii]